MNAFWNVYCSRINVDTMCFGREFLEINYNKVIKTFYKIIKKIIKIINSLARQAILWKKGELCVFSKYLSSLKHDLFRSIII